MSLNRLFVWSTPKGSQAQEVRALCLASLLGNGNRREPVEFTIKLSSARSEHHILKNDAVVAKFRKRQGPGTVRDRYNQKCAAMKAIRGLVEVLPGDPNCIRLSAAIRPEVTDVLKASLLAGCMLTANLGLPPQAKQRSTGSFHDLLLIAACSRVACSVLRMMQGKGRIRARAQALGGVGVAGDPVGSKGRGAGRASGVEDDEAGDADPLTDVVAYKRTLVAAVRAALHSSSTNPSVAAEEKKLWKSVQGAPEDGVLGAKCLPAATANGIVLALLRIHKVEFKAFVLRRDVTFESMLDDDLQRRSTSPEQPDFTFDEAPQAAEAKFPALTGELERLIARMHPTIREVFAVGRCRI